MSGQGPRDGRRHGAAMLVWLFFANLFDPKAVVAVEQVDAARRGGDHGTRRARTVGARPGDAT